MTDWWQGYYSDIDHVRLEALEARHAHDVVLNMAGQPAVRGIEQVMAGQRQWMTMFKSLSPHVVNAWGIDATTVLDAVVTYVRQDDRSVDIPCTTVLQRTDELVDSVRVYIDVAPVFA